ncbi:MAG TPA: hypothetical protein VJH97_01425 [Candidatus Nanoarchaeia archaeon]|nr:hypothetical protein [Candidatus Nanoarchaeia archaeon]
MTKVRKSEYIIVSRTICKSLRSCGCYNGTHDLYFDNLAKGLADRDFDKLNITKDKIRIVVEALCKQGILHKRKKMYGWKYSLEMKRIDKIMEICKETGTRSIVPILLML